MGVAPPLSPSNYHQSFFLPQHNNSRKRKVLNSTNSMSQGFHQGIFGFSDGFDRSSTSQSDQRREQEGRRDTIRMQQPGGFGESSLLPIEGEQDHSAAAVAAASAMYENPAAAASMFSDMFSFQHPAPPSATDLLASQISTGYRLQRPPAAGDWYNSGSDRQSTQMYLMNPQSQQDHPHPHQHQQRSSSPPSAPHNSTFQQPFVITGGELIEGQGLSLSLSSSLQRQHQQQQSEQDLRDGQGMSYLGNSQHHHQQPQQQQQQTTLLQQQALLHQQTQLQQLQVGIGYAAGVAAGGGGGQMNVMNVMRHSKYARPAQELLEEFCSVGRGERQAKGKAGTSTSKDTSTGTAAPSPPQLTAGEKFEHQRKKAKLISMLDEVDRRYNNYCDQMQLVVNSFDSLMGYGAATPYTILAQKAMSRHFRCLKDAINQQLKQTCEILGDKDGAGGTGITKGETPRLRLLEQSLRQQRAFHQMGMMEQEAWRPQRGLPERSVNMLRAWLFEHFLHPYPSDADKHLLARQTGLSRNQVTNWFINARVRLWKPMVEDMYQQEAKEEEEQERDRRPEGSTHRSSQSPIQPRSQRPENNADDENDPSSVPSSSSTPRDHLFQHQQRQQHRPFVDPGVVQANQQMGVGSNSGFSVLAGNEQEIIGLDPHLSSIDEAVAAGIVTPGTHIRFGTSGDVSLTLGLRHASNLPDNSRFSLRDFNP